ncbi:hypothetical protein [Streptomyces sp. NBC_01190]|uniref:hypothetical protein n=1 Tax=Streptomyces sp. NBC_01190 TaxID=2903767 RepID=UPI00386D3E87
MFGSGRCDCGPQVREAVEHIAGTGGYLLYLRREGRGIGLNAKLDAYASRGSSRSSVSWWSSTCRPLATCRRPTCATCGRRSSTPDTRWRFRLDRGAALTA